MDGGLRRACLRLMGMALPLVFGVALVQFADAHAGALATARITVNASGAPDGMNFLAEVHEALAYISRDPILEDVLSYGARIEIRHTADSTRIQYHARDRNAVILFNPRLGIRVRGRRIQSPALVLAHELGHVYRALRGASKSRNGRFTPAEETAVIKQIEMRVARVTGEPVRHAYIGTPVEVRSVTLGRAPGQPIGTPPIDLARRDNPGAGR